MGRDSNERGTHVPPPMPWLVLVHLPHDQAPLLELAGSVLLLPPPRGGGQRRAAVAILAQESDAVGPPS